MPHIKSKFKIYVSLIEVEPLEGCELDPSEYLGASVRAYIPAENIDEAQNILSRSLADHRFGLREMEFLVAKDDVEWENPDDPTSEKLSKEALRCNKVVYGEFYAWDSE